jgi:hypothetical protein
LWDLSTVFKFSDFQIFSQTGLAYTPLVPYLAPESAVELRWKLIMSTNVCPKGSAGSDSPLVILDEIEKAAVSKCNGNLLDALLPFRIVIPSEIRDGNAEVRLCCLIAIPVSSIC